MAEWLVEHGIGEDRAMLVERGRIIAGRVNWPEALRPGAVIDARLAKKAAGTKRGLAIAADGTELLLDRLPPEVTEGQTIRLQVTRSAIAERGRNKRALARPAQPEMALSEGPDLVAELKGGPHKITVCRPADGTFTTHGWDELIEEALSGEIPFSGGNLLVSSTPAMTLIDIDGDMPSERLALAAVTAIAAILGRLDIAGSVGIDFPSLQARKDRQAVDEALAVALKSWQGERTAMNGFGFVQLVSRLQRPSILALYQRFPERVGAITLARRAEAVTAPGAIELTANPALRPALPADFEVELARRTGRSLRWRWDESVALTAPHAQAVTP